MNPLALPPPFGDIPVRQAAVPRVLEAAEAGGVLWQASHRSFLLQVPGVARFLVEGGELVTIDPSPGATDERIGYFLGLAPLAALACQRGWLALHAATVKIDGDAVLLAGDSGCGKSSLAVELTRRGATLLGDDLALVTRDTRGRARVAPGVPEAVLWTGSLENLGLSSQPPPPFFDHRHHVVFTEVANPEPIPVRAVFALSVYSSDPIVCHEPRGAARFRGLGRLLFNSHIADVLLDRGACLGGLSALAGSARFFQLKRPRGVWRAGELADMVAAGVR